MVDAANIGVTLTAVKGSLVATLHANLQDSAFDNIRNATLDRVAHGDMTAVIFDLSALRLMDAFEFERLRQLAEMLRLLGCRSVLVGLSAGVVAYLVDQNVDTSGIEVARGLENALEMLAAP